MSYWPGGERTRASGCTHHMRDLDFALKAVGGKGTGGFSQESRMLSPVLCKAHLAPVGRQNVGEKLGKNGATSKEVQ